MPTRRHTLLASANLLAAGVTIGSGGSLTSSTSPSTDFRVIAPPGLRLVPGRDDLAHVDYEIVEEEAHVTAISIKQNNSGARSDFEDIVEIVNETARDISELYFEFEAEDPANPFTETLSIISGPAILPGTGETDLLKERSAPEGDPTLIAPGERISFGVRIDLLETALEALPDPETVTLRISAVLSA